jgi:hypothetical protein
MIHHNVWKIENSHMLYFDSQKIYRKSIKNNDNMPLLNLMKLNENIYSLIYYNSKT